MDGTNGTEEMHQDADVMGRKEVEAQTDKPRPIEGENVLVSAVPAVASGDLPNDEPQEAQCSSTAKQISKLKDFLSDAANRGDDIVTQSDADTVRDLEKMQHLQLSTKSDTLGLGARLESAARANFEIQNQAASGYYPSETVYLEELTLKDVLEESGAVFSVKIPPREAFSLSPDCLSTSVEHEPSPTKNIDAESDLKNELDCLFEERAHRFRGSP